MKKISAADTLELSIAERIQLVEDIWDTIAAGAEAVDLTLEEKQLIDNRLRSYHENPEAESSWEEVYKRIAGRR